MVPTTIEELIIRGKGLEYSHRTLNSTLDIHDVQSNQTIRVPYNAIIGKYWDYFKKCIISIELTEEDKRRYWHNPRIVSYDTYGTVEYWSLVLYMNECASPLEFEPEDINIIDRSDMNRLIMDLKILDNEIL